MQAHTYYTHSHALTFIEDNIYRSNYRSQDSRLFTVTPVVNQSQALIVLDGFEPPALIQTRPLFKPRPLFGHIYTIYLVISSATLVSGDIQEAVSGQTRFHCTQRVSKFRYSMMMRWDDVFYDAFINNQ